MKKQYRLFAFVLILMSLLLLFAACNNPGTNPDPVEPPSPPKPIEPEEPLPVNINIELATDDILGEYENYHEFVCHEDGEWLIVSVDQTVQNFGFISIGFKEEEDEVFFIEDDTLFSMEELTPDEPFVVKLTIFGYIPSHGIKFTDTNEIERHFTISLSGRGEDEGPLYLLIGFEN